MAGQQFPINLSGILVAAMLVLAALLNQPPLQSERPPAAKIRAEPSGPFEDIPARIWEDPLEAVARVEPESPGATAEQGGTSTLAGPGSADRPPTIIARYLRHLAHPDRVSRLLLMPVMISGAPHPALREQRLRMRVALHAGLDKGGFLPLRGDRVGNWTWEVQSALPDKKPLRIDIPFEAFKRDRTTRDGRNIRDVVLLLWLNDEYVSQDLGRDATRGEPGTRWLGPLSAIDELMSRLDYPVQGQPLDPQSWRAAYRSSAIRVIGPASSDSLEPVYVELLGQNGGDCVSAYRHLDNAPGGRAPPAIPADDPRLGIWGDDPVNFKLISPHATAPQADLVGGSHPIEDGPVQIHGSSNLQSRAGPCATLEIHRTIATDDRLIDALIGELRLRGVDPVSARGHGSRLPQLLAQPGQLLYGDAGRLRPRDHLVLISEWDTKFGRTLPSLFEDRVGKGACSRRDVERTRDQLPPCWVHRFSYMRGLDGDTPAPASGAGKVVKPDIVSLASGNEAGFKEPAVGANQYDYLRRLTELIADLDWTLKRDNQGSVKAFGILGNDYFDKLLILQALKERFPSHLYFTTDLDAGYLDARVFRWTRNLVIAAPFGLTLRRGFEGSVKESLQGGTPPFRHSIQTSLYLTVVRTLQGREAELGVQARGDPPLLFEVGYGEFFRLKSPEELQTDPSALLHPDPSSTGVGRFLVSHALGLALAGGAALGLILVASPSLRHPSLGTAADHSRGPWVWLEARAVLLLTLFYLVIGGGWLLWTIQRGEEPFAWFSGVSIWPSEIVRLLAGWMAGLCLVYGWRRVREADRQIAQVFDLPDPAESLPGTQTFSAWYCGVPEPRPMPNRESADESADPEPSHGDIQTVQAEEGSSPRVTRLAERICKLFAGPGTAGRPAQGPTRDGADLWRRYLPHASLRARFKRVLPLALLFWALGALVMYGLIDPLSPHRGLAAYLYDTLAGLLLVALPFVILLFAAVDEARLCRGLLCRLEGPAIHWPIDTRGAGCEVDQDSRRAVDYWITTELIAERTAPAAHVIHLPFVVILFLLLSLSTRFDNWNTPASVLALIGLAIIIGLSSSLRLRRTAQRIRQGVVDELKEEVTGIEYAAAKTQSDKLQQLVKRIEAIHEGAFTKWYNEPVFRALAWVLGIGLWIVTEYAKLGS